MCAANATCEKDRMCTNLDITKEILIIVTLSFLNIKKRYQLSWSHSLNQAVSKLKFILKRKDISPINIFWRSTASFENYFKKEISSMFSIMAASLQ